MGSENFKAANMVFIIADEHQRNLMGCYGNSQVRTPNLDALAARGVRFTNAYTPSPICVPARAALATGRNVHEIGSWDNAFPYTGKPRGWAHQLSAHGFRVESIGKLHYRRAEDDNGFGREHDAMYVAEGIGEVVSCLRERAPHRKGRAGVTSAGPGQSSYLDYDRRIANQAADWLAAHANDHSPWVLFVSFVNPHPPFVAPPELYRSYDPATLPLPHQWKYADWPDHPALNYLRTYFGWEEPLSKDELSRVLATYYAQCEFVDQQIGHVLAALDRHNLSSRTRIIYTSDHGAMVGARGLYGKFTLYDEAAAIPLLLAGPDVPSGRVVNTPTSLIDCAPTILQGAGCPPMDEPLPGASLLELAEQPNRSRLVLSQYHAAGSLYGAYMITDGRYKYNHYTQAAPQLFDLNADPAELDNLAAAPAHASTLARMHDSLLSFLDPAKVDALARADQRAKVMEHGGEAAVLRRGLSNSPVPGEAPKFHRNLSANEHTL